MTTPVEGSKIIRIGHAPSIADAKGEVYSDTGDGFVSHSFFYCHEVRTCFIKMKPEAVAECMAVESAFLPAEGRILLYKFIVNGLGGNMPARLLSGEKPVIFSGRCVFLPDILLQDRDNTVSQDNIPVRTVFVSGNIDMFLSKIDIPTMKAAEFADPDTRRIQKGNLRFMFDICERIDQPIDLWNGEERGKRLVIMEIRNFTDVPVFVKDIDKKVPKLCNINIDSPWVQKLYVFEIEAERTDFFLGNTGDWFCAKFRGNPVKEDPEIGNIGCDGSIRKFTERKDIGMFLDVIVIIYGISPPL